MDNASRKASCNLIGAVLANAINVVVILIFISRLAQAPTIGYWLGITFLCSIFPLAYLFWAGILLKRQPTYFVWIGLMILFVIVEALLDYIFHVEFRTVLWQAILYVVFFFAATGGMIGVASQAGKKWMVVTVATFWVMAILAFVQRYVTGM